MNWFLKALIEALISYLAKIGRKKIQKNQRQKQMDQAVKELESAKNKEEVLNAAKKLP